VTVHLTETIIAQGARRKSRASLLTERRLVPFLLILPTIGILAGLILYPLLSSFNASAYSYNLSKPYLGRHFVGVGNFLAAASDPLFIESMRLTFILSAVAVGVELILGLAVALLLNSNLRGMGILQTLIVIPLVMTPVVAGLTWRVILNPSIGMANFLLESVGLPPSEWNGSPRTALLSVAIVDIWRTTPFVAIILLAGLQGLPAEPLEAAKVDGAGRWKSFRYITLPMLGPLITVALLIRVIYSLQIFDTIMILTQGGPGFATEVFNVHLYKTMFRFFDVGYGSTLSIVMLAITLSLCFIFYRYTELATGK
jgi:multiple sugar transport system permease protein